MPLRNCCPMTTRRAEFAHKATLNFPDSNMNQDRKIFVALT
jgi:hypothetical protein